MTKKKETRPQIESYEIEGHSIQIRKEGDVEQLSIDGIPQRFFKGDVGYVLNANAYAKPQKTLMDAVRLYLQGSTKKGSSK